VYRDILKTAQITPIQKTGSYEKCSNYRPISLLPPINKVFEKLLYGRLYSYLEHNKLLTDCQYGFRRVLSTELAINDLQNFLMQNIDKGLVTCSIFLDLARVFDTVNHDILHKLDIQYGIKGLPLSLLKSYLENRSHYAVINDSRSEMAKFTCGVPLASTLGPLLFLLYVNDLPLVSNFKAILFADDTVISLSANSMHELTTKINQELESVDNWLKYKKLSLNYSKTKYMLFTKQNECINTNFNVQINNHLLSRTACVKYLGVIIDDKLIWKPHITLVKKQVSKASGIICKLRHYLPFRSLKTVYYSIVYSHLRYAITSWCSSSFSTLRTLNVIHNKLLRIMTFSKFNSNVCKLYKDTQILTIDRIFKLEISKLMYKIKFRLVPKQFTELFTKIEDIHSYHTRQRSSIEYAIPRTRLKIAQKSLTYAGIGIWSFIDPTVRSIPNYHLFVTKLKHKHHEEQSYHH